MKKKIAICIGTRPEAIKMAPLVLEFKKDETIEISVCVTGQHREMVDQVMSIFNIEADEDFDLMGKADSLTSMTALLLSNFDRYFDEFKPDLVLAQGDTSSVFSAAYCAYTKKIPFGHVEAGLRTYNIYSPWPEEGFRCMVSPITTFHFAPTQVSRGNLLAEGVLDERIFVTGNTVIDALLTVVKQVDDLPMANLAIPDEIKKISDKKIVLITGHRRENLGDGLANICTSILKLSKMFEDVHFVFPVHLNPKVREQVYDILKPELQDNICLIEPLPYREFAWLMKKSLFIVTDSGGIQEEAPSLGKPVLVTRDTTERPEGVEAGTVKLVGTVEDDIVAECVTLLTNESVYKQFSSVSNPYGDGNASKYIAKICKS